MYLKIHDAGMGRTVVAVCDKELVGKKLVQGDLEINATERFYKGEEVSEEEVVKVLKEAANINLLGKKAVDIAVKAGIVAEENVLMIQGVPHACSQESS